jgi:hypothetical protein
MEKCDTDFVEPLNIIQNDNWYILTAQDELTNFLVAVPLKQQPAEK